MHIYPWQMDPPQSSIDALITATPNLAHLMADVYIYRQCTYTHGRWTPPWPIKHRCLEYYYTKLGR